MIWEAGHIDVPDLVKMGRKFHAQANLKAGFNPIHFADTLHHMIDRPDAVVYRTETGMIGGALSPAFTDKSYLFAVELFWWGGGKGLPLFRKLERWAEDNSAEFRPGLIAGLHRADKLLRLKGYEPTEITYSKG